MTRNAFFCLVLAMYVLAGCADPTGYSAAGNVWARSNATNVELGNRRSAPIYYFIVDRGMAASIN